ncbi:PREDICTED: interleukin-27 receptor subunit alpha-like, partial [Gekko japonicus]|uniref:Interleukin-27 receptor subunit alpha-like n=1 Tax=Gekko japonicus TaxID=146911 RepID=A0ABM1JXJ4_GEKJA
MQEAPGTMKRRWKAIWLLVLALKAFGLKEGDPVVSVGLRCLCLLPSWVMNCSWSAPDVNATYVLVYRSLRLHPDEIRNATGRPGQNWIAVARSNLTLGDDYSAWLEVLHAPGVEASEKLNFSLDDIGKPPAPELDPVAVSSSGAMVRWKNPSWSEELTHHSVVCQLRYKASKDAVWTQLEVDHVSQEGHELEDLEPFTWYEVEARCVLEDGQGFWSEWSSPQTFRTPEAAPLGQVDVWREVHHSENSGRTCHLLWKALDREAARGDILNYTVVFWDRHLPGPREVRVRTAQSLGLSVTWTFSPSPGGVQPEQFVVEWREEISGELLGWIPQPVESRSTLLRGGFRPKEPYLVSVYAAYAQGSSSSVPVRAYVQEG